MSDRRGYYISNQYATYFVTFTVVGWVDLFTRKECKEILMDSFRYCTKHKGLVIHAYVIMSSHVHMLISALESSDGLSAIIRDMKKHNSKQLLKWVLGNVKESRREWLEMVFKYHARYNKNNSKYQVWQQDNHPMACVYPRFTWQKINYIHKNPVAAGIVDAAENYVYSSARNYMERDDFIMEVSVVDFGAQEGFVMI